MAAGNPIPFWQLAPLPQPPNDPTWWLLDGRVGWRKGTLNQTSLTRCGACLSLDFLPATGRSLAEPTGSLGGLVPPANVALSADGGVYLFDQADGLLKRFDPCKCQLRTVGCFQGTEIAGRKLSGVTGIAIANGKLILSDRGNARLLVFHLHSLTLASIWSPPASAGLPHLWEPHGIAVDCCGKVFVADPVNGCVHRFRCNGRYDGNIPGTGAAVWVAFDLRGRLYAAPDAQGGATVFTEEGEVLHSLARPEDAFGSFANLPFTSDSRGNLALGTLCIPPADSVFDVQGNLLPAAPVSTSLSDTAQFFSSGTFTSDALDSKLYRCQWHRVVLKGTIPTGTAVTVTTYTNDVQLADDEIAAVDPRSWHTRIEAAGPIDGEWDCLIQSGGGRFLWLQLVLDGDGAVTPVLESVKVEYPRISLRRYLPAVFGEDSNASNFTDRFLSLFDTGFRSIETEIDTQASLFDPLSAPDVPTAKNGIDFLSWLGSWIGVSLNRQLPVRQRRRLLKEAGKGFPIRGTRYGMWTKLVSFLGFTAKDCCCKDDQPQTKCILPLANCRKTPRRDCAWTPPTLILEHYKLRRWLVVGAARLGDQAVLWGKNIVNRSQLGTNAQAGSTRLLTTPDPDHDPFLEYAHKFSVFVPASCRRSDQLKRALSDLLDTEKPAHTAYQIEYVEPRFRIGFQSMIGLDSVVGKYPSGFTLG